MVKFGYIAFLPLIFGCKSHKNEPLEKLTVGTPSKTMVVTEVPGPPPENIMDPPKPQEILLIDDAKPIATPKEEVPTEGTAFPKQDTTTSEPIHQIVEQMPEFPGGQAALNAWLVKNLEYPEMAREQGIEGKVFVQFNVYSTGICGNFSVLKSPSPILSNAALKTMKKMPAWKPGMQNGKAVNTIMRLPISYKLR
jgi:protein TonB